MSFFVVPRRANGSREGPDPTLPSPRLQAPRLIPCRVVPGMACAGGASWQRFWRTAAIRNLSGGLPVIVGAGAVFHAEISDLSTRGPAAGRLSVDVAVDPPVDLTSVRHEAMSQFDPNPIVATVRYRAINAAARPRRAKARRAPLLHLGVG
jgi:hypothetical protein